MSMKTRGAACVVALLGAPGFVIGSTNDINQDALSQIAELKRTVDIQQAEIAELKAADGNDWLTEKRAGEIRGIVEDVLADSGTRASLQSSGATAGWDKGFFLASADGNFRLNISGQIQTRWVWNHRKDPGVGQNENEWGFEMRRVKLKFKGHVVDPSWQFYVNGGFGRNGGFFNLEDAWIRKDFGNGFAVKVGQYKAPFLREELVSSSKQLMVERSLVNEYFNQGRDQGISLEYAGDAIRGSVMYSQGIQASGNGWTNGIAETRNTAFNNRTTDYAFAARAEFKVAGDWKQFKDFTSFRGEDFGLMIGAAMLWERANAAGNTPEARVFGLTADVSAEFGGANLFGSFVWRDVRDATTTVAVAPNSETINQWGFVIQGGVFVTDEIEIAARYSYGDSDTGNNAAGDPTHANILTFGVNWYMAKHAIKWTTDFGYAFDPVVNFSSGGADWLQDAQDESGQFVLRTQLQLLF